MKKLLILVFVIISLVSCDQFGNTTIKLEPGEKLVEVTWKSGGHLWYLVEPMDSDYTPKTKVFKEISLYGVSEDSVTFIETR